MVPQYLLCPVAPPFGPQPTVTWLSRGCVLLRTSLGVSLSWVLLAGTDCLSLSSPTFTLVRGPDSALNNIWHREREVASSSPPLGGYALYAAAVSAVYCKLSVLFVVKISIA